MARVSKPLTNAVWFYPDGYDEEEEDPFRVELEPLSAADVRRLERENVKDASKRNGKASLGERIQGRMDNVIGERIKKVEGFGIVIPKEATFKGDMDTDGIHWPKTGKEFVSCITQFGQACDLEIMDTIYAAMRDHASLGEDLEKK